MSQGVISVATGQAYVEEACPSATSLQACVPTIHVTLFTEGDVNVTSFSPQQEKSFFLK